MKKIIMIKYGEISLKGLNRKYFIDALMNNSKKALYDFKEVKIFPIQGRVIIKNYDLKDEEAIIKKLQKVFGIVQITPAYEIGNDLDEIKQTALMAFNELSNIKTFKVESRRSDKKYPLTSPEISKEVGGYVLSRVEGLKVDVHNPDVILYIEVREKEISYVYAKNYDAPCGLPVGTSGKGGLLLSGGLDSPVAGYLMNKRGMKLIGIHFHSYPYTSKNAQEKVIELAKNLSSYNQGFTLAQISLTKIQEEIIANCNTTYLTVILRRFMIECANRFAKENNIDALITGESLGQVASQTPQSIHCTNQASFVPIYRPLIAMDKTEIVQIARKIGTYDTSILPYEDCCTLFVPKHPQIHPKLEKVLEQEKLLAKEELILNAIKTVEYLKI